MRTPHPTAANFVRCRVVHHKEAAVACRRRLASVMAPLRGRRRLATALRHAADPAVAQAGLDRAQAASQAAACRGSASLKGWMKRYANSHVTEEGTYMFACIVFIGLVCAWRPVPGCPLCFCLKIRRLQLDILIFVLSRIYE